jgi:hypothetical protein
LGERLLCKQEVIGSIPFTSTTAATKLRPRHRRCDRNAESAGPAAPADAVRRGRSEKPETPSGRGLARGRGVD